MPEAAWPLAEQGCNCETRTLIPALKLLLFCGLVQTAFYPLLKSGSPPPLPPPGHPCVAKVNNQLCDPLEDGHREGHSQGCLAIEMKKAQAGHMKA